MDYSVPVILNSKGNQVVLNENQTHNCKWMANQLWNQYGPQRTLRNAAGYEAVITTLTTIKKKVSEQKFYTIRPSDFYPVVAGEGTWSSNLQTFRSYEVSDIFESGIIDTGGNNDRLSAADAQVDSVNIQIQNWAKSLAYSIFDLELAAKSGNWSLVEAKEKSRKRSHDLGLQKVAFLGAQGQNTGTNATCLGALNQAGVTFNSTLITQTLSTMSYSQLNTFIANAMQVYQANCNYTAYPTSLWVPQADFNGLIGQVNPEFPMLNRFQMLADGFRIITQNPAFKILGLSYAQYSVANSLNAPLPVGVGTSATSGLYVFSNYDEESWNMNVPLPYTTTLSNSINSFQFQNVGMSQFTGNLLLRPLEVLYAGF